MKASSRILGGILLIAGTSIGAGLLALPVETGQYGYLPSLLLLGTCWIATLFAALYMLEANLWLPHDSNLISMAEETLGLAGKVLAWVTYLLLLYTLMVAYLSGMNSLLIESLATNFGIYISKLTSSCILIAAFGAVLYLGTQALDYLNRALIIGLAGCFLTMIFALSPNISLQKLSLTEYSQAWHALPVLVTTFGYQIVIPSVRRYLHSDVKHLVITIVIGSTLPLIVYLLWDLVILGVIPAHGTHGLDQILASGDPALGLTASINSILNGHWVSTAAKLLSFFVIATSFLGVSLSLFDFLCDGFHVHRKSLNKLPVAFLTFIPPMLITLSYSRVFMAALGYAGILVAVLLIILPIAMVISGRYYRNEPSTFRTPGGIVSIVMLVLFALSIIIIELSS